MKVSKSWLKELVDLNISVEELVSLLPLRAISTKEVTNDFIELDMKGYNRADLLSLRGIAQEIAAITGSKMLFKEPTKSEFIWSRQNLLPVKVEIEDEKLCPVYCVAKIENLRPQPSPKEWVKKLVDSGVRTIDTITDITNLIMLEYGQTVHAFDAAKVIDETMIVRLAKQGEEFETLDGKVRKLTNEDLLITDPKGILSLSGIMGGKNSEITESTHTILLEVAIFDPISIRKSSQRFGLHSEASKRIQHGLTKTRLLQALNTAIKMYQDLGGKLTAISLVGNLEDQIRKITLTKQKLEDLVGVKFENSQVEDYLKSLYFKVEKVEDGWVVEVPYFRLDINLEEDVIEEVARIYGYEKIPAEKVSESEPLQKEDPIFKTISGLREKLVDLGLTEVQTYSFYTQDVLGALGFDESNKKFLVKVANPISAETEYLRMNIWPNLVEVLGRNLRKGYSDIAIFEIGKTYHKDFEGKGEPKEGNVLSIALYNGSDNPLEELVSIVKELGLELKLDHAEAPEVVKNLFHPKRFVHLKKDGKDIGGASEVHLRILNKLGIEKRVAVLEVEL